MQHRRRPAWRTLTKTRYLVAAFVVAVVVFFVLDKSHQPSGCHFVHQGLGKGAYAATRVCPKHGTATSTPRGVPSSLQEEAVFWALVLGGVIVVVIGVLTVRGWRDLAIRRARRR